MLSDAQMSNPETIVIPTDQGAIGMFNAVFMQTCAYLVELLPREPHLEALGAFAAAIVRLDSANMMLGVRVWLDYFNASVYPLIQDCDERIWQVTTFMGVPMQELWPRLPQQAQRKCWLFIQVLVNLANILAQVPRERLIQLNSVIVNFKDLCVSSMPFLTELVTTAASEFAPGTPGGQQVSNMLMSTMGFLSGGPR